ncbi:MAG TPA: acyl-ACP--UDP-N-acetylglucosamine O-acyltransferase [Xanthobacteraceae bacterium]|jgi:UDP-N-acetylglucosamine acyltransferase|nr:acyl-ACP--UDP-N-acetylglucosamine O-acyltransferase [Xanthobacteraceae bacterium]
MAIDPTARVAAGARIDASVEIGPYCIVGPQVKLQRGVRLLSQVNITGVTTIGEETVVYPFSSLGTPPQSVRYRGGPTKLVIGARCELREGVTMNTGTEDGGGITRIGERCSFMVGSHVGHDCLVGNNVTLANNTVLGGHVEVGDFTFLGGHVAIHQFVRIGEGVMMAGMSAARDDIIPFGFALGQTGALVGLNIVGLRRRGGTKAEMHRIRRAYRSLFFVEGRIADRIEAVAQEFADDPVVSKMIEFIRAGGKRPLMRPRARRGADIPSDDADAG